MEGLKRERRAGSPLAAIPLFVSVALMSFLATCRTPREADRKPLAMTGTPVEHLDPGSLRDQVREIIRPGCGSCHTSTLSTAKPGALAIFDLAQTEFASTMTVEHLESFRRRLRKLEDADRALVRQFVEAQIAHRTAPGADVSGERTAP